MKSRTFVVAMVAMYAILGLFAFGFAMTARAQGEDIAGLAASNIPGIAIITVVAGGAALFVKGLGSKVRTLLIVVALVGVGLLALAFTSAPSVTPTNGGTDIKWTVAFGAALGAADAASEILDTQGFTACDGGTPDLNGVHAGAGDEAVFNNNSMEITFQSDMDQDAARNALTFSEIDCLLINVNIALTQPRDLNGDGTADAVAWGVRMLSFSPTTITDWNTTALPIVYFDNDQGWSCAAYNEGTEWVSLFGNSKTSTSMPTSGDWVYTGTHAGGGAASDTAVIACVLNVPNGGGVGYQTPPVVPGEAFRGSFAVGSPEDPHVVQFVYKALTRA